MLRTLCSLPPGRSMPVMSRDIDTDMKTIYVYMHIDNSMHMIRTVRLYICNCRYSKVKLK